MSDDLYEVAFSGQIIEGADLNSVKAKVGQMFKADGAKLEQLFSGKRIPVKRQVDRATAEKYKVAFERAGAQCEVKSLAAAPVAPTADDRQSTSAAAASQASASQQASNQVYTAGDYGEVAPPPQVVPLDISGDDIEDLSVSLAPVGAELADKKQDTPPPEFDFAELDVAPVGSQINTAEKEAPPPPPDTSGITMAD